VIYYLIKIEEKLKFATKNKIQKFKTTTAKNRNNNIDIINIININKKKNNSNKINK